MRAALAAVLALGLPAPALALAPALTLPPNGISGCGTVAEGGGGVENDPATFQSTPAPGGGLDVTVDATASDGIAFPGLYVGSFEYSCNLLGTAFLDYGTASGTLQLQTSSTPDQLEPEVGNPNDPFRNDGRARGEALLELQFDDRGVVTSGKMPNGTPVNLDFTFALDSTALVVGPPVGALASAGATYEVRAEDLVGGTSVQRLLLGNEIHTLTLATQVGRTVDLRGTLRLRVQALAGREVDAAAYYAQADASIDASNTATFTLETPPGVGFDAESGHDYAVPEAAAPLELAAGALALGAVRARRRRGAAPGVASALHRSARERQRRIR
jgi:hypothetical protein